jgi:hypothetical protein
MAQVHNSKNVSSQNLLPFSKASAPEILEVHSHCFVSGPRSHAGYRNGVWTETTFSHSHPGGSEPHRHPDTGPSFYGYCKPKVTKRPTGYQGLEVVPLTEEENTFELIVTDSALIHGETPIGDTPVEALGFPAAERMMSGHRLKCIIRDERTKGRSL